MTLQSFVKLAPLWLVLSFPCIFAGPAGWVVFGALLLLNLGICARLVVQILLNTP